MKKLAAIASIIAFMLIICSAYSANAAAGDSVKISIETAEKQFLERNFLVLAEKYNIEAAKAELVQAKLFNNPSFSAGIDIFNPDNKKWFDATKSTGQYTFSIEQVIRIGGQRNKEIALAKTGIAMSENQFYDLIRTLRLSLNSIFYELYYTMRSLEAFDTQIELLEDLKSNYNELEKRGVVPLSEVVRIHSLLYSLKSDQLELKSRFNELQGELQLLLQDNQKVFIPEISSSEFAFYDPEKFRLSQLISDAYDNRMDLKLAQSELEYHQKNLALQKSKAVPDLTLGAEYDKRGNFTDNLFCLNMSIDLPFFNRNQGSIRSAKTAISQSEILIQLKKSEIENEVRKAYFNALDANNTQKFIHSDFEQNLQLILQSVTENFKKKNISLLEFTDFYESYRDNIIKMNQIRNQKVQTMETLRFAVGQDIHNQINQ